MAESEILDATCRNCGKLYNTDAVDFGDACSLACGIELSWERQESQEGREMRQQGMDTAGF